MGIKIRKMSSNVRKALPLSHTGIPTVDEQNPEPPEKPWGDASQETMVGYGFQVVQDFVHPEPSLSAREPFTHHLALSHLTWLGSGRKGAKQPVLPATQKPTPTLVISAWNRPRSFPPGTRLLGILELRRPGGPRCLRLDSVDPSGRP